MEDREQSVQRVRRYYQLVDAGEVSALVRLFSPDAVYQRPGYQPIRGRVALERFYLDTRVIASGTHTLLTVLRDGAQVAVRGEFEGILKKGTAVRLRFADFFGLAEDGLFASRHTYFFQPLV